MEVKGHVSRERARKLIIKVRGRDLGPGVELISRNFVIRCCRALLVWEN